MDKTVLKIEICPDEPRAEFALDVLDDCALFYALQDCNRSGDVEPACRYICDTFQPSFVIADADADYDRRDATPEEIAATCRAIYFDSESDFEDETIAAIYLIWQAASGWWESREEST